MSEATGSKKSAWGGLLDKLSDVGMGVLEAGGERIASEISGDRLPPTPSPNVTKTEYQGPTVQAGTANRAIAGVTFNPVLMYGALGLLGVALVLKVVR
tara:strand:- start:99897 stop:100190 length:294 start_codon:yes stop_codon:yes gene_type:complete